MTEPKAGLYVCPECGDRVRMDEPVEPWNCVECNVEMQHQAPDNSPDTVPKADLRELVEKWERTDWETQEANLMARECASDVREVLEEHE